MRMRRALVGSVALLVFVVGGCGGGGSQPAGGPAASPAPGAATPATSAPAVENRWLRGLAATDVKDVVQKRGLACKGPEMERGTNVWRCEARTPLVTYHVEFYGPAPLKIEYVTATVTQVGVAKDERVTPLFTSLAGLHYEGCEPAKAREWVAKTIAKGGDTTFGPAKYRLRGDALRRTLDIKASGSEW